MMYLFPNMLDSVPDSDANRLLGAVKACFFDNLGSSILLTKALEVIGDTFRCTLSSYQAADRTGRLIGVEIYPNSEEAIALMPVINGYLATEHPLVPIILNSKEENRPLRLSDYVSAEEFRMTNLYRKAYAIIGWEYQMVAALWDRTEICHSVTIGRRERDFTESERQLLQEIFSQLLKALKCNHLINERLNQLQTADQLTRREAEVLHWVSEGKTNPEIATILGVSSRTIDKHCSNLFEKLGFENRAAAVRYAMITKTLRFSDGEETQEFGNL